MQFNSNPNQTHISTAHLTKRTMNHTNEIECRQNENNKTTTTISLLVKAKENLEFKLSSFFSLSLSLFSCLFAVWLVRSLAGPPLIHIGPEFHMHRHTPHCCSCGYTHRIQVTSAVFYFCRPFVCAVLFFVEPELTEFRADQFSYNRKFARNGWCIATFATIHPIISIPFSIPLQNEDFRGTWKEHNYYRIKVVVENYSRKLCADLAKRNTNGFFWKLLKSFSCEIN